MATTEPFFRPDIFNFAPPQVFVIFKVSCIMAASIAGYFQWALFFLPPCWPTAPLFWVFLTEAITAQTVDA